MNYILKHIYLLKSYFIIGLRITTEYKFQFITNFLSYLITVGIWIAFWNLLFGKIETIGNWNMPMLIMMVGFFHLNGALWQFCYYTLVVSDEIVRGKIDKYLTRPINPLYGLVMEHFELMALLPLLMALGMIIFIIWKYFSLDVLKLFLALMVNLVSVAIVQVVYCIIGTLSFWFGRTRNITGIYRSFRTAEQFPLDILGSLGQGFFTFIFPAIFMGTYPVLIVVQWELAKSLKILALSLAILFFWLLILIILWRKGVKSYESLGE